MRGCVIDNLANFFPSVFKGPGCSQKGVQRTAPNLCRTQPSHRAHTKF